MIKCSLCLAYWISANLRKLKSLNQVYPITQSSDSNDETGIVMVRKIKGTTIWKQGDCQSCKFFRQNTAEPKEILLEHHIFEFRKG